MKYIYFLVFGIGLIFSSLSFALRFTLPSQGNHLIGRLQFASVQPGDSFSAIARRYDVGYFELVAANPQVDPDHPFPGTVLIIPTQYLLPPVKKEGIVINLASMRLYYFPKDKDYFYTYPVGIGRFNWSTPLGKLHIIQKTQNPTWVVPESILRYQKEKGNVIPKIVPPGPDNPLGHYALRLSIPTYLIHGTNNPDSVGRRSSAGCIHLYPEDIKALFDMLAVNTSVLIINQPYMLGWGKGKLYLEAHLPLEEQRQQLLANSGVLNRIIQDFLKTTGNDLRIDWDKANDMIKDHEGIPERVSA